MKKIDFYFDFSSTNSYFAAFLIDGVGARTGARIRWNPVHSAALFRGTGFDVMAMTVRKARYLWRDHQRYAERTGLPFHRPSRFPIKTSIALRMVCAVGEVAGGVADSIEDHAARRTITQAVMRAYWERDEDIADAEALRAIADGVGIDGKRLIERANSESIRDRLRDVTQGASVSGVFGLPSFKVGDELFWGKDRLDFVEQWSARTSG
jgi:2-hydroxychromene-2-carboxylate isomerase